jgi:hypothetical protein
VKKIIPPTITYIYANSPESQERVRRAYFRIFNIARQNLLKKHAFKNKMGKNCTLLTTKVHQSTVEEEL